MGREKDIDFVTVLLREKMISGQTLEQRIAALPEARQNAVHQRLDRIKDAR